MNLVKISLLLFFSSNLFYAQNDCHDMITVCGNSNLSDLTAEGTGLIEDFSNISRCKIGEYNSLWLKIDVKKGGTLGFILTPENKNLDVDFDFFVFGPNVSCDNLKTPIRYSYTSPVAANLPNNTTGMDGAATESFDGIGTRDDCKDLGYTGNGFVRWLYTNDNDSYFIVISRFSGTAKFSIKWTGTALLFDPPTFKTPEPGTTFDLEKCDTDIIDDDSTVFDLTPNIKAAVDNLQDIEVTFHTTANDVITGENAIQNPGAFANTSLSQQIYMRLTNTLTKCFSTTEFTIKITKNKLQFPITSVNTCDDSSDGSSTNGKAVFYFKNITETLFPNAEKDGLVIKYYTALNDVNTNSNELVNSFYNTTPNQQYIYAKAYNHKYCTTTQKISLIVNTLPPVTHATLIQCDSSKNQTGLVLYNLDQANAELTNNDSKLSTQFFLSTFDAANNQNPLDVTFHNTINPQTLFVRITNLDTKCWSIGTVTLKTNPVTLPEYFIDPACDDDGLEDGIHVFDLTKANIPYNTTQNIKYFSNENNALLEQNEITDPGSYHNETPYNQFVFARVEEQNSCFGISKIKLEVNQLPNIQPHTSTNVCENNTLYQVHLDAGIINNSVNNFSYKWTKDGTTIPNETTSVLNVNKTGIYTVIVTNKTNCSKTRIIEVFESNTATIQNIEVIDLSDENKITVNVSGKGDYEFSLNLPDGPFQESNIFNNVEPGIYEVYVNDKKNCGTVHKTTAVIGAPKYFTPNDDGYHDYWNIEGLNENSKNAIILIYDRYGKLLKQIQPSSLGWDGTFTGNPLPADDYWYTLKLEDNREAKGHFSLKR